MSTAEEFVNIYERLGNLERHHDPVCWGGTLMPAEKMLNEKIGFVNERLDAFMKNTQTLIESQQELIASQAELIEALQRDLNPGEQIVGDTDEAARARLDVTSYHLVATLKGLIDTYGFRGVESTLMDLHIVMFPEEQTPDAPKMVDNITYYYPTVDHMIESNYVLERSNIAFLVEKYETKGCRFWSRGNNQHARIRKFGEAWVYNLNGTKIESTAELLSFP